MQIYHGTGVTSTGLLKSNKSAHAIYIASTALFSALDGTELITVYIERPSGSNEQIATNIPLVDFIVESTYGSEAIQADATFGFIAKCEITNGEGSYRLTEGENLYVKIDNIKTTDTWRVGVFEDPIKGRTLKKVERKTVASEDFSKVIVTDEFSTAVINDVNNTVTEYVLTYSNGEQIRYTPFELQTLMRDSDPIAYVTNAGSVKMYLGRIVVPLRSESVDLFITQIEVLKPQGSVVNVLLSNADITY